MGDSAASGGGGGGIKETVVIDHGRRRSSCGYCKSGGATGISHGFSVDSMTVDDYQDLLDRGWRRSGSFIYKPNMEKTCCPSYTIRLKAGCFVPTKEQIRVQKKMQRFLDGSCIKKIEHEKEPFNALNGSVGAVDGTYSAPALSIPGNNPADFHEEKRKEDSHSHDLGILVDESIRSCIAIGEFPPLNLPKSIVAKVKPQVKKKLLGMQDVLYTCSIPFQIAAALRRTSTDGNTIQTGKHPEISPDSIAETLELHLNRQNESFDLSVKACKGHLNFFASSELNGSVLSPPTRHKLHEFGTSNSKRNYTDNKTCATDNKRQKLEIRMHRSSFDPEEYALYRRYQICVHDDRPEKVTESSYRRFLVDTPLDFVPPRGNRVAPPCGFGSFHQQYLVDGKLVAVGVVDVLPRCLSSKYLFWDPEFAFLSLGKYSALQEINWVKEAQIHCSDLQYYYLGYYIHSCRKMRYKAAYKPSELLCPLRYTWVPFDIASPLLDEQPYVVLSDCEVPVSGAVARELPCSSNGLAGTSEHDYSAMTSNGGGNDIGVVHPRSSDSSQSEESDGEIAGTSADNGAVFAVANIVVKVNGSRVKFKDLQRVFGPIDVRTIRSLEMQLHRYVKAVGNSLAARFVYSLD